ncbi:DUF6918 family protein [Pseudonocardia abyssalis]|uniref:DUF2059 domain-containing protein n=1 Tax=Pseudonocardia abyssalis TaxID=2792008 RepID=A0ABS6US37_9PSEU|nr:hypothetical protein [Pseudonocardia abyssalis]MBW0115816.1 hypothetical protein [Pseudonocardia abyssalis]MBW0135070.1 hypothetical protein [Pseudonocardia abyssalis]
MTQSLNDILLEPARRPTVVTDLQALVDQEVSDSGGVSGAVIKTGYATVKKVKPGIVSHAVDTLLPEVAVALQPFYDDYRASAGTDFGAYLSARPAQAATALLGVADSRAEQSSSDTLKKVYAKLRPQGQKNVEEALPRLGRLIDQHAGAGV